jgi:16S rRNA (cytosine1402-N4)-methyltransferase
MSESIEPEAPRGPSAAVHQAVLLREVLEGLALEPGLVVVDGTVGAGGHSRKILERIGPTGLLIGVDRDPMMLGHAARVVSAANCRLVNDTYAHLDQILADLKQSPVDRVLLDLGLSSDQLADRSRGFSFQTDGPLDLRFNPAAGVSAADWLADVDEAELIEVLTTYAEEPKAAGLARAIVRARKAAAIRTARQLADVVAESGQARMAKESHKHPATRVFQALRIVVNEELKQVETFVTDVVHRTLKPGGRLAVITFHSLEDRIIKQAFREAETWQQLNPKPVAASIAEQRLNPRARTALLRVAIRK